MSRNPKVFLSISINNKPPNHITIQLFSDTTPKTAQHFLSLCTANNPTRQHYRWSTFHRVLPGICQAGALWDPHFKNGEKAENFIRKHDGAGTVSMVTPGGPQFFISTARLPDFDGGYVVVGRVLDGMSVVSEIQSVGSLAGKTCVPVVIVDCGEIREGLELGTLGKSLLPLVIVDSDEEDENHANMDLGLSLYSVAKTCSEMPCIGRGSPPGSGWRQRLSHDGAIREELELAASQKTSTADEVIDCDELPEHANIGLELSLSFVTKPSLGEITTSEMPCRGFPPGSGWRQTLGQVGYPQEQEIKCTDHVSMSLESSLVSVPTSFPTMPKNPKVYLDITINNQPTGRIIIELFTDTTPHTANYFLFLCTSNNPKRQHYKGSTFNRVLPGLCQGGNIHSCSENAKAENFIRKHDRPGTVSMVSPRGPQFFILTTSSPTHDNKYVVVGHVIQGLEVVDAIQAVGSLDGKTNMPVMIVDCGQLREELRPALEKSSMTPVGSIDYDEVQEKLAPALEKSSTTTPTEVIDCDEVQEHANMGSEVSLVSVAMPSSGEEMPSSGTPNSGSPPGCGWRQNLAQIGEKIISSGMPRKRRSRGRLPGNGWRQNPIRVASQQMEDIKASQQEQVITTCIGQLSNSLEEIMDVTESIAVDDKDVNVLENDKELVEVLVVSEQDLNASLGLNACVCSMEKRQNELLSHTRTQVSTVPKEKCAIKTSKNKKIKSASLAKHVDTSTQKSAGQAIRKCSQCNITKTPCWRSSPLGQKTLCNACWLHYNSSKVFPEYRPTTSPAFVPSVTITDSGEPQDHGNMRLELPLVSAAPRRSSRGNMTPVGKPRKGHLPASLKMSFEELKQVISTSNRQLSDSLKEIMNVNKQLISVDANEVHVLESETESVEDVLEHNHNILLGLKAEVCSLEKSQTKLVSQIRTKISNIKNNSKELVLEMIPSLSYEDLVSVEDLIKKRKIDCRQSSRFK